MTIYNMLRFISDAVQVFTICDNVQISVKYMRNFTAQRTAAGMISIRRGKSGGCRSGGSAAGEHRLFSLRRIKNGQSPC